MVTNLIVEGVRSMRSAPLLISSEKMGKWSDNGGYGYRKLMMELVGFGIFLIMGSYP